MAARRNGEKRPVEYRTATYTFRQLRAWRDRLRPYLRARDDIRYLDLDEVENKIVIAVARGTQPEGLRGLAAGLGLPDDVVVIGEGERFRPDGGPYESSPPTTPLAMIDSTLSFKFDSVPAGVQIKFTFSGWGACTQGFSARRISVGDTIFVTASHCTEEFADSDGTDVHQGTTSAGDKFGDEAVDPEQPCGTKCRNADVAVFQWTDTTRRTYSRVARTENSNGSRTIDDTWPRFSIDEQEDFPTVGDSVHMMGQSSGWRKGKVIKTCVDVEDWPSPSEDYTLECQDMADYHRASGDSGAPVYYWDAGLFTLIGIHTGAHNDSVFFGAVDQIEQDIGSIKAWGPFIH